MDQAAISQFLKSRVILFDSFTDAQLIPVMNDSTVRYYEPNESIIEFAEDVSYLYVLLDGIAESSVTNDGGDKQTLCMLAPGEIFGEIEMMTGKNAIADVVAVARCQVLQIPEDVFSTSIAANLPAISYLSRIMVERLQVTASEGKTAAVSRHNQDPYGFNLRTDRPMKILVINCGSSSLKYNLFDTWNYSNNASGIMENIGSEGALHTYKSGRGKTAQQIGKANLPEAFAAMIASLTDKQCGVLSSLSEISAVGHRVVHGGAAHSHQTILNEEVIKEIEKASVLAPLHNPANLEGIHEAQRLMPDVPQVAVFDTAFHQVMPSYAYLYGLPYEYFEQKGIRRYGFHGISHKYVSLKVAEFLKQPYNNLETIVCHLGNGASVCAVDHGRSVDTSMGMTPTEGLIMGSRCGDIDPAILIHLMRTDHLGAEELNRLINKDGGLKGLSGISNDMREIEAAADAGDTRALQAVKTFCYRVRKYIGSYVAAMGGLDALAFTGGIGQGSVWARSLSCQGLAFMGIRIDEEKNRTARGFEGICDISADDSKIRVLVVPTDEERMIARETLRAIKRHYVDEILHTQVPTPLPIEISAHHVHLTQHHVEALFGKGHELTVHQMLSQPGQFACGEKVNLIGPRGRIENVRILGPTRSESQVEIAMTEQFKLGIQAPIRESGAIEGTPGVKIEGPEGIVTLDKGVICALRHIHMTPDDALHFGLKNKDIVRVRVQSDRDMLFGDVLVRISPDYKLAMHLDTDEGNAANIPAGAMGYIDGIESRK